MFAKVKSMGLFGMEAFMVEVEADISQGLPKFDIVGLPDTAVNESKDRVRSAIKNCKFDFPVSRITINLAPADRRKEGPLYDLPILVALLSSTKQLICELEESAFIGELSLSGNVNRVNGAMPMVIAAKEAGIKSVFVPGDNAAECSVVEGIDIYPVHHVSELIDHLKGTTLIEKTVGQKFEDYTVPFDIPDFSDVKGQYEAKRALEIAAAGSHNILMIGPPGSGKSMLAKRIPSILPDMTFDESIETTKLYSIAGLLPKDTALIRTRPFRSPHHTVSPAGLSGGGAIPRPGEISLAHNGVLFLDELPEFSRSSMEAMRQPIEDGVITISRVAGTLSYPCTVMVVGAMNPCPCGFFGHPTKECTCSSGAVSKYINRVSGPMLDRIDIHIEVPPVEFTHLADNGKEEPSAEIRKRVNKARKIQQERFKDTDITCNARMTSAMIRKYCILDEDAKDLLRKVFDKLGLSARAYDKILKVARTIADLDNSENIALIHIAEAIQYRSLDRKFKPN